MATTSILTELQILNAALQVGFVKFSYYKADGSHRIAVGTRNNSLIESLIGRRLKNDGEHYYSTNGYWDLTRADWRKFATERFDRIELERMSNEDAIAAAVEISLDADEPIKAIEEISIRVMGTAATERTISAVRDHNYHWCVRHNGGYGLNGVSLAAGGLRSSGFDCFGSPISIGHRKTERTEPTTAPSRSELIAELNRLRQRETEILRTLLSA